MLLLYIFIYPMSQLLYLFALLYCSLTLHSLYYCYSLLLILVLSSASLPSTLLLRNDNTFIVFSFEYVLLICSFSSDAIIYELFCFSSRTTYEARCIASFLPLWYAEWLTSETWKHAGQLMYCWYLLTLPSLV